MSAFVRSNTGVTAIEYAIMAGLIAVVIVGTVYTLGQSVSSTLFSKIAGSLP